MATETLKEYRKMAADQLKEREDELRSELFKLRTTGATEKVKDTSKFRKVKKDIARILTLLHEQKSEQGNKQEVKQEKKQATKKTTKKAQKA